MKVSEDQSKHCSYLVSNLSAQDQVMLADNSYGLNMNGRIVSHFKTL